MYFIKPTHPWASEVRPLLLSELQIAPQGFNQANSALYKRVVNILKQLERGELLTAYLDLGELIQSYYWSHALHFCAAHTASRLNDRALALSHYTRALNHHEIGPLAARHIMMLLYQSADYQALYTFANSRLNVRDAPEYHYALGLISRQSRDLTSARRAFERALSRTSNSDEDRALYRLELVKCLYLNQRYERALEVLNNAEAHEMRELGIRLMTAKCHFRLKSVTEGYRELKQARRLYPDSPQIEIAYADELAQSEPRRAITHYLKATRRAHCPAQVYWALADLYERIGDWGEALYFLGHYRDFHSYEDLKALDKRLKRLEDKVIAYPLPWYKRAWRKLLYDR